MVNNFLLSIPNLYKQEAKDIVENHFGSLMWSKGEDGRVRAWIDSNEPIVIRPIKTRSKS